MAAAKKEPRKKIIKLKLSAEELKKRRLENLKKANEVRKANKEAKKKATAASATATAADVVVEKEKVLE
jgi:hypothetical protein